MRGLIFILLLGQSSPTNIKLQDGSELFLKTGGYQAGIDTYRFSGAGDPAFLSLKPRGFKLSGKKLSGLITRDAHGVSTLNSGSSIGNAVVTFDNRGLRPPVKPKLPKPAPSPSQDLTSATLTSSRIDYLGDAESAKLSIPEALHFTSHSSGRLTEKLGGQDVIKTFGQSLDFTGSKGVATVDARSKPPQDLIDFPGRRVTKADVDGPVTFHLTRLEWVEKQPLPTIDEVTGTCDHLTLTTIDGGETLVATGHVVFKRRQMGETHSQRATITLDKTFNVVDVKADSGEDSLDLLQFEPQVAPAKPPKQDKKPGSGD